MKWQVSSNFQIYLGKTDKEPPPVSNLHDNFTDLIFRFSGLPAHTADWPPHMWVKLYQYIVFAK